MDPVGLRPLVMDLSRHLRPVRSVNVSQSEKLPLRGGQGLNGSLNSHL